MTWKLGRNFESVILRLNKKLRFTFDAIALGLIKPSTIQDLVEFAYKSRPEYYDLDSYSPTWEEEIIPHLQKHSSSKNLLLTFCGKGRDAFLLARHDYQVVAIDREGFMIDYAIEQNKELKLDIKFQTADFDTYQTAPFDIVFPSIWMFTTYPDRQRRRNFLEKCKECLSPNGVIVLSYRRQTEPFAESLRHFIAKITATITFGNQTVKKGDRYTSGIFWHYFTEPEVEEELKEAGLETLFHKSHPKGFTEWRILKRTSELPRNSA